MIPRRKHIVVGAGSSGLALTRKLLERDDVVLIDRGTVNVVNSQPTSTVVEQACNIHPRSAIWCFQSFASSLALRCCTVSQEGMLGRVICYAQGFGGGGSGGINAMIYTLGSSLVYDQLWPAAWNSDRVNSLLDSVLKYYSPRKMQTAGHVRSIFGDAQKSAATVVDDKGIASEYYAAINTNGTDRIHQASVCLSGATTGTLTCLQHCTVKCVVFEGTTAVALVLTKHNPDGTTTETTIIPEHGGEIILCAGAFETPRILIASGLKQDAHVPAAGKKSSSPLPNLVDIGENLQDHVVLPYMLLSNWYDGWRLFHKEGTPGYAGKPAYPLNGIHGWVNLTADGTVWSEQCEAPPRVQLLFIDGRVSAGIIPMMLPRFSGSGLYSSFVYPVLIRLLQMVTSLAVVRWLCGCFFGILVCVTQPHSRGRLTVNPQDPAGPLLVDPGYLSDARDVDMLYHGMRTARALVQTEVDRQRGLWRLEVFPGPLFAYGRSRGWFDFFARAMSSTYFHACGTCAMSAKGSAAGGGGRGGKITGVVDEEFRVHGVSKLRIADASVIPAIPSSPTQAICMLLGEACGQLLLGE